jgi:hypothetical protein
MTVIIFYNSLTGFFLIMCSGIVPQPTDEEVCGGIRFRLLLPVLTDKAHPAVWTRKRLSLWAPTTFHQQTPSPSLELSLFPPKILR